MHGVVSGTLERRLETVGGAILCTLIVEAIFIELYKVAVDNYFNILSEKL